MEQLAEIHPVSGETVQKAIVTTGMDMRMPFSGLDNEVERRSTSIDASAKCRPLRDPGVSPGPRRMDCRKWPAAASDGSGGMQCERQIQAARERLVREEYCDETYEN